MKNAKGMDTRGIVIGFQPFIWEFKYQYRAHVIIIGLGPFFIEVLL